MIELEQEDPIPQGDLALQITALPRETNGFGDIFGGWLVAQMDLAGTAMASKVAGGRVATVAIDRMAFLVPVAVGAQLSFYTPALTAATVGIAFGQASDVTAEAAGAVILDSSLQKVDELLHIGRRMRRIALQSAVGGMLLSVLGMLLAAAGYLPPVAGALAQEAIDVLAVLNALRAALPPKALSDC